MDTDAVEYVANSLLNHWFPYKKFEPRDEWKAAARHDAEVAIQAYLEHTSDDRK